MIIYFSSTGNSLSIAKDLANELEEEVYHINQALKINNVANSRIGLVFPAHNHDMPHLVQKFVKIFDFRPSAYIFGILTHGGDPGNSLFTFKRILKEKGFSLSYGDDILMPVNSRILYGRTTTDIEELTKKQKTEVKRIADNIQNNVINNEQFKEKRMASLMHNLSNKPFVKRMFTITVDNDTCTCCGICEKVCPVQNITTSKSEVTVHNHCENCLTCIHWCPQTAIGFGKRSVKKKQQYHHPSVKLQEIINQNKSKTL